VLADALVAGEQLVAAVPGEHYLHLLAHLAREIPGRDAGRVGERLVEPRDDAGEIAADRIGHHDLRVGQAEGGRGLRGGFRFIHGATRKGRGEGAEVRQLLLR